MATKKPCPGCGKVDRRRRADSVCGECQFKLARYEAHQKELEELTETCAKELVPKKVYHTGVGLHAQAINALLDTLPHRNGYPLATEEFWKAYHKMCWAIQEEIRKSDRKGFERGKKLLAGLNNGSMSLDDFDWRR